MYWYWYLQHAWLPGAPGFRGEQGHQHHLRLLPCSLIDQSWPDPMQLFSLLGFLLQRPQWDAVWQRLGRKRSWVVKCCVRDKWLVPYVSLFLFFFFSFGSINMWRSCNKNSCHLSNAYSAPSRMLGLPCMWGGRRASWRAKGDLCLKWKSQWLFLPRTWTIHPRKASEDYPDFRVVGHVSITWCLHLTLFSPAFFSRKHKPYLH